MNKDTRITMGQCGATVSPSLVDIDSEYGGFSNLRLQVEQRCDSSFASTIEIYAVESGEIQQLIDSLNNIKKELELKEQIRNDIISSKRKLQKS
jgi:hypothetical protein